MSFFIPVKKNRLLLFFLLPFFSCVQVDKDGSIHAENKVDSQKKISSNNWISSDEFYSFYYLRDKKIKITNIRPLQSDTSIKLCIPAAFTQLDDGSIDGLFMLDGKIVGRKKVNHHLGGGLLISNNQMTIIKTDDGKFLTDSWIEKQTNLKSSFFQQIQLVRESKSLEFHKDQQLFQRRAVVDFPDGNIALIESKSPLSLQEFADDLAKMKVWNAIYIDMGSYDEGWYRNTENGRISILGSNRSQTQNQSNWLLFTY